MAQEFAAARSKALNGSSGHPLGIEMPVVLKAGNRIVVQVQVALSFGDGTESKKSICRRLTAFRHLQLLTNVKSYGLGFTKQNTRCVGENFGPPT